MATLITEETIQNLTQLSRIDCTEAEKKSLLKDMQKIMAYIDLLNDVDTDNVPPCNYVLDFPGNVLREDVVETSMPREAFLANAPSQIGGMIRVPPVLK